MSETVFHEPVALGASLSPSAASSKKRGFFSKRFGRKTTDDPSSSLNNSTGGFGRSSSAPDRDAFTSRSTRSEGSGKCRHNFPMNESLASSRAGSPQPLVSPANVSMGTRGVRPGGEKGSVFGLRIYLKKGVDLLPCDSSGLSDPFVKFSLGKHKVTSRVCKQTLNPVWGQEFFVACPQEQMSVLKVEVWDKDRFGEDFMGGGDIRLEDLVQDEARDVALELTDNRKNAKLPSKLGTLQLALTKAYDWKNKKKRLGDASRLVTVDVIEARELLVMDSNGLADPYVKVQLGKLKQKTKVCSKTLDPQWRQRLEFHVHDQSQVLSLVMYDKDDLNSDDLMGQCQVDLMEVGFDNTFDQWLPLDSGGDAGEIHVRITQSDLYSDAAIQLDEETKSKFVGSLIVKVIRGKHLEAKDIGGKSDPFVVVELGMSRLRTKTCPKTLSPIWDKVMELPVEDIFDVLHVTVYDEDKGGKSEFMGRVAIPLLQMTNCVPIYYPLKKKRLMRRHVGELELEFILEYKPLPAYKGVIKKRQVNLMSDEPKFKMEILKGHIARLTKLISFVVKIPQTVNGLFTWQYGFFKSLLALIVWIFAALYLELWMLPLFVACYFSYTYFFNNQSPQFSTGSGGLIEVEGYDEDDEDEEEDEGSRKGASTTEKKKGGIREKYAAMQRMGLMVQEKLDLAASTGERIANITNWSVPLISTMVFCVCFVAALGLYLIPLRYLILLGGVNKFVKKGLQHYTPFGYFKVPKNKVPVNTALEFLSRVPSDLDKVKYRRLATKREKSRKTKSA